MNEYSEFGQETPDEKVEQPAVEVEAQPEPAAEAPSWAAETPFPSAAKEAPKRRKGLVWGLVAAVILLFLIAVAAVVVFLVLPRLGGGEQILVALPLKDDMADVYVLKLGQELEEGVLVAEEVGADGLSFEVRKQEELQGTISGGYGGFVPDSNRVLLWHLDDDETVFRQMGVGEDAPADMLDAKGTRLFGTVFLSPDFYFLREYRGEEYRCYVAKPGSEAERIAKAEWCNISTDGSTVYVKEEDKDGLTLTVMDTRGEKETVLLDEVENVMAYRLSSDASHVAYVQGEEGEVQLYLVERSSGDETEVSDEVYEIENFGFVPHSDILYYLVREDEGDDLELYTSESDDSLASGVGFTVRLSADGKHMAYRVEDEDGDQTLYVHTMGSDQEVEVLDGEQIGYGMFNTSPPRLLVLLREEDEFTVFSAKLDGSDVVELLQEDDATFQRAFFVQDEPTVYIEMRDDDGDTHLFVTPIDKDEGFVLLKRWGYIQLLNRSPNGRQVVFWGREDREDDPVLYSIALEEDADPVELDDDSEGYRNAVFTSNGRNVLYTAITGDDPQDVSVYQVRADGEDKPEELYEEAILLDVRWDDLNPFD